MINMSPAEIGRQMGTSRANAGQCLKNALRKVYRNILREKLASGPYEAFDYMTGYFELYQSDDIQEFFETLPKEIKEQIRKDAESQSNL